MFFFLFFYYRAVLYGGVGSIMGHELTHGFDVQGRYYQQDTFLIYFLTAHSLIRPSSAQTLRTFKNGLLYFQMVSQ